MRTMKYKQVTLLLAQVFYLLESWVLAGCESARKTMEQAISESDLLCPCINDDSMDADTSGSSDCNLKRNIPINSVLRVGHAVEAQQ